MSEALEKWPIDLFSRLLPRIYQIVDEINRRFVMNITKSYPEDKRKIEKMAILYNGQVRMANLAIAASFSVNGVARLHTIILKSRELKDFYEMYPERFNNKTNGITQRRFLLHGNPLLAEWVTKKIGDQWITNLPYIEKLSAFAEDRSSLIEFMNIKHSNKERLARYIKEHNHIDIDTNSIFDIHVKRLHEYKRQLLNILHVMYLYNLLRKDPNLEFYPRTFIFGAKASAGYERAKSIIKLINTVGEVINNDTSIGGKIKVIFIENYRVSNAELLFSAADVSEQISTASTLLYSNGYERADQYFILKDFRAYEAAQKGVSEAYQNKLRWAKSALLNTAKCGKFSSDRTIEEYVKDVWHLEKVIMNK